MRKLLPVLLLLAACGDEGVPQARPSVAKPQVASVSTGAAELVPGDATMVVKLRSLGVIKTLSDRLEKATGSSPVGSLEEQITAATRVPADQLVPDKEVLIAVKLEPEMPMPVTTWILPVKDAQAVAANTKVKHAVRGDYVAVSLQPDYQAGGSKLTHDLPDGDAVLRIDLAAVVEQQQQMIGMFRVMAKQAMSKQAGANPAATAWLVGGLQDFLDSAETLDLVARTRGRAVDIDLAFTAKAGSPLDRPDEASGLGELAAHVPADLPLMLLFTLDMASLMEIAEQSPSEKPADFAATKAMVEGLGPNWVGGFGMGADGIRIVCAANAKDAASYVQKYVDLIGSKAFRDSGVVATPEGKREVAGTTVHRLRLKIDAQKYGEVHGARAAKASMFFALAFGEEGAIVDLAAKGDRIVVAVDRQGTLCEQALRGGDRPDHLADAMRRVPGDMGFLFHMDFRGFAEGLSAFVATTGKSVPEIPAGEPLPITIYGSRTGRVYRAGLSFELEQTIALAKIMR